MSITPIKTAYQLRGDAEESNPFPSNANIKNIASQCLSVLNETKKNTSSSNPHSIEKHPTPPFYCDSNPFPE